MFLEKSEHCLHFSKNCKKNASYFRFLLADFLRFLQEFKTGLVFKNFLVCKLHFQPEYIRRESSAFDEKAGVAGEVKVQKNLSSRWCYP